MTIAAPVRSGPDRESRQEARSAATVLVVDDERSMRELLEIVLRREGYTVLTAEGGGAAVALLERHPVDLLITDMKMPDMSGVDVLRVAKRVGPDIVGIVVTAYATVATAVEAMQLGAYDYVTKPFNVEELKLKVRKALERRHLQEENELLRRSLHRGARFSNIIGQSDPMQALFRLIETIGPTNSTVLVTGESGTGKELAARAVHFVSPRRERPFVALNCGALPEPLLESELFGHVKGAFTGAAGTKKGLIEVADKGTIFLDEIGEMSPMMQVKLLRVLQERTFRRVGGTEEIEADIRIIAATNRELGRMVQEGRFREDLFYRINVIPVELPPLRERHGDIPLLATHFVGRFARQMDRDVHGLTPEALRLLELYPWPGNIRELENALERAVALERTSLVQDVNLPERVRRISGPSSPPVVEPLPESGFDLETHVQGIERRYIAEALRRSGGVKVRAAELLGMSFRSFRYYLKKYNLN